MKTSLAIALATLLTLCGCSVFHRSPTWDAVVASRSHSSSSDSGDGKDGYLNHLHQVLQSAGVAHKIVTYQFHFHNVYREVGVQTATAVLYSDDTTPRAPWWVMDEYHHVPVWLPNWELNAQLEFFIQRPAEVISVKDYPATSTPQPRVAKADRPSHRAMAHSVREKKFRSLFVSERKETRPRPPARKPAPPVDSDPLTATTLSGPSASAGSSSASPAAGLFRSAHGTAFDPTSSIDRAKMDDLRRRLLNRTQRLSLRN